MGRQIILTVEEDMKSVLKLMFVVLTILFIPAAFLCICPNPKFIDVVLILEVIIISFSVGLIVGSRD